MRISGYFECNSLFTVDANTHMTTPTFKSFVENKTDKSLKDVLLDYQTRGYSAREIANELGWSINPIYKYCQQYGIKLANKRINQKNQYTGRPQLDILSMKW